MGCGLRGRCGMWVNPFSTKRYYSTEFFRFFCRTLGACHTVNNSPILLKSSLLDKALSQLFGEKKTELFIFIIGLFTTVKVLCSIFWPKKSKKTCALLKNETYFQLIS